MVADLPSGEINSLRHASQVYKFNQVLGKGSFGKVYQAIFKPTGEAIAVKVSAKFLLFS